MAFRFAALVAVVAAVASQTASAECQKNAAGAPMATGTGNAPSKLNKDDPMAKAKARLMAESTAFQEALKGLKSCMGADAAKLTGWTIGEVRYFDSDPIVEIDVAGSTAPESKTVTGIGTGIPDVTNNAAGVAGVRLKTENAAKTRAQANAKQAVDKVFPSSGKEGDTKVVLAGMIKGCTKTKISYWDDKSVTVTLECGKEAPASTADVKPTPAPALAQHEAKK